MEIRESPILKKVTLFWLGLDSGTFFLLVEDIIEIRRNPIFFKISC